MTGATPSRSASRIRIEDLAPQIECGRHPVKRTVGEAVEVRATIVRDGHETLRAVVRHEPPDGSGPIEVPMVHLESDRWGADFTTSALGQHRFSVEAWVDGFASWADEVERKLAGGQEDLDSEVQEGAAILARRLRKLKGAERSLAAAALARMRSDASAVGRAEAAVSPDLAQVLAGVADRAEATRSPELSVDVDRVRARFGSWYELFPRSFGGLAGVQREIPRLAELGFDVLYLTPIHPIGVRHRKGPNNTLLAAVGDPGSPWAIGGAEGGHTAVHPELGTLEDVQRLAAVGQEHGVELALDFAVQCSPDHPWLAEHPDWFHRRPDGTLKYAENPPKKYQDIYNVNFDTPDWRALWAALLGVVLHWCEHGVRIFRVDNPHTKPLPFWEWLVAGARAAYPDAIFLAEAFTRPAMMKALGKVGFNQSYTYFTWRTGRREIEDYLTELSTSEMRDYYRPNFFANTPDILHEYLQTGGRPAFEARLVLAATLSPSYGIYSGYEHFESLPVRPGSEEYLDSEKYEAKQRALDGPLLPLVGLLNRIRREHEPLQHLNVRFLETENELLIAYLKGRGAGAILTCVNLDPQRAQEGGVAVPWDAGLPSAFTVTDLLSGARYPWRQGPNYVRLDPATAQAHVLRVER